jgi:CheY-like chemotaxis protein
MSRTILLADDSLTIQQVVELTFADTDYEVVAVSSGDDLLQRLPECQPDLVICDVIMPGRDGYDVCQEIKSNADFLHVPVILLTGTFEPFDRDRALAAGCSEIITKPFEARKLLEAVDRLSNALGAAPPPAPSTDEAHAFDVEVTPPPPMDTPEEVEFTEDEMELEDTAVIADDEEPDTGFIARSVDDEDAVISTEEEFTQEIQDEQEGFELALDEPNEENEPPILPNVDAPPDAEVFPDEGLEYEEPATEGEEIDTPMTTPIDVAAVISEASWEEGETDSEIEVESTEADISDADTQDITEQVSPQEPADEPESTGLSDDDVDRIARRLLELAGDRIEHIAWDVIPDMAELVVRERVLEIEATAERERS